MESYRHPSVVFVLLLALVVPALAQHPTGPPEKPPSKSTRKKAVAGPAVVVPQVDLPDPSSPTRTQLPHTGRILGQVTCDRNGAVYLQPQFVEDPSASTGASSPIVRITSDGSTTRFAAPSGSQEYSHTYIVGHAVDRDGRVFLLTMRPGPGDHLTILQLAEDSSVASTTELDRELRPGLFAVLPSGDFLIGGVETGDNNSATRKSVLSLFGRDGRFEREFLSASSKVDIDPQTKQAVAINPTESFGSLQIGDDNNIYVLLPGSPPRISVFDETGAKLRTLKLDAPPQARLHPEFFVSGGRIVVPYWSTQKANDKTVDKRIFRTYDAQTGIAQIDYASTFRGAVACVDHNDLIFLVTGQDGTLSLARASLR